MIFADVKPNTKQKEKRTTCWLYLIHFEKKYLQTLK